MKKPILILVAILALFTACQKVVDADNLLDTQERVFITSYISPQDTVLSVSVSRALPSIGTSLSINDLEANEAKFLIKDATVTLSDEAGTSTDLIFSEENKTYLADANTLAILSSQTYFLKVNANGKEFNASCRIPEKVIEINEQANLQDDAYGNKELNINLSFKDFIGRKNFYVLGGLIRINYQFEDEEPQTYYSSLFADSDEFLTDNLEDGGTISGKLYGYLGSEEDISNTQVIIQVASVEEILFQNLRSAGTNANSEGNPFVEYAITPNNILDEGAVGVFAGYQLTEKEVILAPEENP